MTTTYHVRLKRSEGALLRMLGLVGRRGFEATELRSLATGCGRWLDVTMTLVGERPRDVLARQIDRLFDVERVAFADPSEEAAEPAPARPRLVSAAG